jgi:BED zinc finger
MPLELNGESREAVEQIQNNVNAADPNPAPNSTKVKSSRKLRSKVWNDFEKVDLLDGSYNAKCKHCKTTMSEGGTSGTSHLKYHLNHSCMPYKRAMRKNIDVQQKLLQVRESQRDGTAKVDCFVFNQEKSRKDYSRTVSAHGYPFCMANHHFFSVFVKNLNPQFKLNKRNTIRTDCVKLYREEKAILYDVLDKLNC